MKSKNALTKVIRACIDEKRMLEHEMGAVQASRGEVLQELAQQRGRFVDDARHLMREGGQGSNRRSWAEVGREMGREIRTALGGQNDSDSVASCKESCRRTENRVNQALAFEWPDYIRNALVAQRDRLDSDNSALSNMQ